MARPTTNGGTRFCRVPLGLQVLKGLDHSAYKISRIETPDRRGMDCSLRHDRPGGRWLPRRRRLHRLQSHHRSVLGGMAGRSGPAWVYRGAWPRLTAAEQVTATGQFRIALIQFAGAAGAVVALAYTARTYRLAHRGQLTERFSKALERLGSDEPYVRLGGVHALAHVLRDSADHHL